MESITNAQLLNAIKLLTRKVENLQMEIADLKGRSGVSKPSTSLGKDVTSLPQDWKYSTVTALIVNAVLTSKGTKEAAASLSMTHAELQKILKDSGIPHMYGEKWSTAIKRALSGETAEDNFTYPEDWFEKKEKIVRYFEKHKLMATAKKLEAPPLVVGRFIEMYC